MFQIRLHGRGGQGVVTGAEMLSIAAFVEGRHAQAFPSFGSERTGAPVVAFCRIDDKEIRLREPILDPDAIIIQDPTLLHQVDVFSGLKPREGCILINTSRSFEEMGIGEFVSGFRRERLCTVFSPPAQRTQRTSGRSVSCGRDCACAIVPIRSSSAGPVSRAVSVRSNQTRWQGGQRSISTLRP